MKPFGLSVHQSASYVIGRRAMGFKETIPKHLARLIPPDRRNKHHWSQWNYLTKNIGKKIYTRKFYNVNPYDESITTVQQFIKAVS